MASQHAKALRALDAKAETVRKRVRNGGSCPETGVADLGDPMERVATATLQTDLAGAADRLESQDKQLRIARAALRSYKAFVPLHPDIPSVVDVLETMRLAGRKKA